MHSTDVFETTLGRTIYKLRYSLNGKEDWADTCKRVVDSVMADQRVSNDQRNRMLELMICRQFIPGGRYLSNAGRNIPAVTNCILQRAEDSREGWGRVLSQTAICTMLGAGVGTDYSDLRPEGAAVSGAGGTSSGPIGLMEAVNDSVSHLRQGGQRRGALWAGLRWDHPDVFKFLTLKDWSEDLRALKRKDLTVDLPMAGTNISVIYDKAFFDAYDAGDEHARRVWLTNCRQAFKTAEPGWSINYNNPRESLRNPCCEVVSEDNNDRCNLGTLWMNRFSDEEISNGVFAEAVELGTLFLMLGGEYSTYATPEIKETGRKNNRIGLGLGGFAEWLHTHGSGYEMTPALESLLTIYRDVSDASAVWHARLLDQNEPKGKRAMAPNGTIGLVAESTSSIEPLFCAAYKRMYLKGDGWRSQYVVDGAAKRMLAQGVSAELIDQNDAYALSFENRVKFQYDVQKYVDMSISSTCNMTAWGSEKNNESTLDKYAAILRHYGPGLRGFTCYPDGARDGQPITKVSLKEALANEGVEFEEHMSCEGGVCGS